MLWASKHSKDAIKVLLIDDENDFTELLAANLEDAGNFTIAQVNDPMKAMSTARDFKPDICVVDLIMPKMDGGDVINAIHSVPGLEDTPMLMLTALVEENPEAPDKPQLKGGLPFVSKTSETKVIVDAINSLVAESKAARRRPRLKKDTSIGI